MESIVITGMGAWTCFGRGVPRLMAAIRAGERGLGPITRTRVDDPWYPTREGMEARPDEGDERDFPARMALLTAQDAWSEAGAGGAYPPDRVGVFNGSSHASNHGLLEHLRQRIVERRAPDAGLLGPSGMWATRRIAAALDARGPNVSISTACSSGLNAIGVAALAIGSGRVDAAIAGGHDMFSALSFTGFSSLRAVDPKGARPFDIARAGMSLGDGAAYCVLEREEAARRRGAPVLAHVTGYASVGEGYHPTAPDPTGRGAEDVMRRALSRDPRPSDLAFVSAHGTGTQANDGAELAAIGRVARALGIEHPLYVSSLKSQIGHTLGAAGALQVVATVASMREGVVPGTVSLLYPIAHAPPISLPRQAIEEEVPLSICSSFGFAGSAAALCLRRDALMDPEQL